MTSRRIVVDHVLFVVSELFPNMTVDLYECLSHLSSSHAAEPERVAAALRRLWDSEEAVAG